MRVGSPDDDVRRAEEIGDPGALAEEFRAHRGPDRNLRVGQPAGESWDHHFFDCSRRDGAADDDAVVPGRWRRPEPQCLDDVVYGPSHIEQVRGAACGRRRPDTYERRVGSVEGVAVRRGGVQGATGDGLLNKRVQSRLGYRAAASANLINLGRIDVDAPYVVTLRGQAGCRHRADIAKTHHRDFHQRSQLDCCPGPVLRP